MIAIDRVVTGALLACALSTAAAAAEASFADFDTRAQTGEALTVVFFGGSLTWGANASDPNATSYRGRMMRWLRERYPQAPFTFHDAAIGGTGSTLGINRLERDVLAHEPDLVFLDFTANDGLDQDTPHQAACYEAIVRELVGRGIPVVQCLFGFRYNFGPDYAPETLLRRTQHLALGRAYGLPQADLFPYLQAEIEAGRADRAALWPFDGAHPDDAGYAHFFEVARRAFAAAVAAGQVCVVPEEPVAERRYVGWERRELADASLPVGWAPGATYRTSLWYDGLSSRWMDRVVVAEGDAAPLRLTFTGTAVGLFGEADHNAPPFTLRIDGETIAPPKAKSADQPWDWSTRRFGQGRLMRWIPIADGLEPGEHVLEIVPLWAEAEPKAQLRINSLMTVGE